MALIKEELLKPRIEVIADYPNSPFAVGDILLFEKSDSVFGWYLREGYDEGICTAIMFENYPHLFRQLPWHEKRELEDMPEYVKMVPESILVAKSHKFDWEPCYKVSDWRITEKGNVQGQTKDGWFIVTHFQPAAREEYEAFIGDKSI